MHQSRNQSNRQLQLAAVGFSDIRGIANRRPSHVRMVAGASVMQITFCPDAHQPLERFVQDNTSDWSLLASVFDGETTATGHGTTNEHRQKKAMAGRSTCESRFEILGNSRTFILDCNQSTRSSHDSYSSKPRKPVLTSNIRTPVFPSLRSLVTVFSGGSASHFPLIADVDRNYQILVAG